MDSYSKTKKKTLEILDFIFSMYEVTSKITHRKLHHLRMKNLHFPPRAQYYCGAHTPIKKYVKYFGYDHIAIAFNSSNQ